MDSKLLDSPLLDRHQINQLIPQSPPFLFLNSVIDHGKDFLQATYRFEKNEPFFAGHFPGDPIVPGVLLCECCLQAGAVFMSLQAQEKIKGKAIVTKMDKVKFKNFVRPEMDLTIQVNFVDSIANYILMSGKISCDDQAIMSMEFMVGTN